MTSSTRARARKAVTAIVVVAAIVVAILSAWWYYASPVERDEALEKSNRVVVHGAITGGVYALLAVGFSLQYGVTEVINMGYGAIFLIGTYFFFVFGPLGWWLGLELLPALILATILAGIVGVIVHRLCIHYVIEDPLAPLVTTVGVGIAIQQISLIVFGPDPRPVRLVTPEPSPITVLGASVYYTRLLAFVASLVLFAALWIFVTKTKTGGAMRAIAQDREVAMLMGINTERLYALTMLLSASLAALAGILSTSSGARSVTPYGWTPPLIVAFAVVILGGLGSIKGSLLGAFILGYAERSVVVFVPGGGYLTNVVYLGIMVLVLILRPKGLFGKRIELE